MQSFQRTLSAQHVVKRRALYHNLQKTRFLSVTKSCWNQEKPESKIQDFRMLLFHVITTFNSVF
jgi:hypothetical protein